MRLTSYSCHFQNCKNFWNRTSISWVRTPWRSGPPVDPFWTPWCLTPAEKWAEIGRNLTKISQKSLKISHFYPNTIQIWSWYGLIWPLYLCPYHIPPIQAISTLVWAVEDWKEQYLLSKSIKNRSNIGICSSIKSIESHNKLYSKALIFNSDWAVIIASSIWVQ